MQEILSLQNARVKQWVKLQSKKGRQQFGQFILEGVHLIEEAVRSHIYPEIIAYSLERGIPNELTKMDIPAHVEWIGVSEAVLAKSTETEHPQPVFAVARKPLWEVTAGAKLLEAKNSLVVVCDTVQDPGNVGTIIRSADAVGADGVILGTGSADLYNPKTVRSTMGSLFHLPVIEADLPPLLLAARNQEIQLVSASLGASKSCYELNLTNPTWLIIGNEGQGVSREVSAYVNTETLIPMKGQSESLNAAMAATILLFEAMRQRDFAQ